MNDERLWAPWRLEYVSGNEGDKTAPPPVPTAWQPGADEKCFLCRAAAQYDDTQVDRQLLVTARDTLTMVVINRYPYSNGHLMIAPRRHVAQLSELTADEHLACMDLLARMTGILGDALRAEGFNIGLNLGRVAGAGCPGHLHWHIVPRWVGDSNFMTVLAGTRVIPQALDALWELLTQALHVTASKSDSPAANVSTETEPNLILDRERVLLAPYAMHSADSAGRKHPESTQSYRGPFQRDRDRVIHCSAFRRLSHKTQVFTGDMGDYHRTRLTHTLEVASIARTLARALRLNEDLVEALALAHDIGHPPFGHSGEDVLNEYLRDAGGFNHNAQALRIVELLENRYPEFPGLNLSREVLEGQSRRIDKSTAAATSPLLEVQVVDAADSIAYDSHDADDSLELGMLALDQLLAVPLWREVADRVRKRFSQLDDRQLRRAIVHELIHWQVDDLLAVVEHSIDERDIRSVADVRQAPLLVTPSPEVAELKQGLERFLFKNVYRHHSVEETRNAARQALKEMFDILIADPQCLPAKFRARVPGDGPARSVADYLAGMTDRFALDEHRRLTAHVL